MNAIVYMMRKSIKNTLLDMLHHPARLIAYLFVIAILLLSGLSQLLAPQEEGSVVLDLRLLEGIYLGLLLLVSVPSLLVGMKSGANIFTMSDVNMLFVSPISPKRILLYGLIKQMSTTLLVAVCLIAYGGMAVNSFGIPVSFALLLLLGFALMVFVVQLLTMLIYSFTNGNPRRIRGMRTALYLLLAALAVYIGLRLYTGGLSMETACAAVADPWLEAFPFVGWMKGFWFALYAGDAGRMLLFGGLLVVGTAAAVLLFMRSDADYYEDVLQNAETTYAAKAAAKEGRFELNTGMGQRKIKVRDTGIGRGWGATAFFFKQLREMKRRSRLIFVGWTTLILTAGVVFMTQLMTRVADGEEALSPNLAMMVALMMGIYLLFFTSAAGEWGREMTKPYLYLAPCPPFQKLLWASMTSLVKPAMDGFIAFLIAGIACGASALTIAICILLYLSFGALFTASNILSDRLLGQVANRGLLMILYILLELLLVAPGLIVGIVLGVVFDGVMPGALMGAPVVVWNLLVSLGIYALCRNSLHDMEVK